MNLGVYIIRVSYHKAGFLWRIYHVISCSTSQGGQMNSDQNPGWLFYIGVILSNKPFEGSLLLKHDGSHLLCISNNHALMKIVNHFGNMQLILSCRILA